MGYKNFFYSFPTKYIFGNNSIDKLEEQLQILEVKKVLVLCGQYSSQRLGINTYIDELFAKMQIEYLCIADCKANPDSDLVHKCESNAKIFGADMILAIGGGSVIDTAKAVAVQLLDWKKVDLGVILTLPASGSECNSSFVIKDKKTGVKVAKANANVIPRFAICDVSYMQTLDKKQLLTSCSDIMSHLLEQLFAIEKWGFVDFQIYGCMLAIDKAVDDILEENITTEVLETIMLSASFALSYFLSCGKTMDWIGHTIEHALAGLYDSTHGISLSVIMPRWISYASQKSVNYREKLGFLGRYLQREECEAVGLQFILQFYEKLGFPKKLSECVGQEIDFKQVLDLIFINESIGRNYVLGKNEGEAVLQMMR